MPCTNRYLLPGHVWHITHRCHKQEFLPKSDNAGCIGYLKQKMRYGLSILNYIVPDDQANRTKWPLIFFQKLHILPWMAGSRAMQEQLPSVVRYIVYFSNIPEFLFIIIALSDICSVPMKYTV